MNSLIGRCKTSNCYEKTNSIFIYFFLKEKDNPNHVVFSHSGTIKRCKNWFGWFVVTMLQNVSIFNSASLLSIPSIEWITDESLTKYWIEKRLENQWININAKPSREDRKQNENKTLEENTKLWKHWLSHLTFAWYFSPVDPFNFSLLFF